MSSERRKAAKARRQAMENALPGGAGTPELRGYAYRVMYSRVIRTGSTPRPKSKASVAALRRKVEQLRIGRSDGLDGSPERRSA